MSSQYITISSNSPVSDVWSGTTQYTAGIRIYTNSTTTDANGRITIQLTQTGVAGGTALFSQVLSASCLGLDGSGTAIQAPLFIIESLTTTQIVFRGVRGTSTGVLIGGTVVSMQFVGAGYTGSITVTGLRA